jgi:hypothetical protein
MLDILLELCNVGITYVYILTAFYICYGLIVAVENALFQATGYTYAGIVSWVVCQVQNPIWFWNLFPVKEQPVIRYF